MSYIITKLQPLKSYPTYQFYAKADSKSLDKISDVFKICILETFKWLRARLNDFDNLPNEIMTPEPSDYTEYSENSLISFSFSNGLSVDVVYIEKKGIWSFKISESDMGANIGQKNERLPVQGRTFNTEIAFIKQKDYVEIGVRTICSEPSDTTADCEVFRPTVVKALTENEDIRLIQSGFIIDGKPLEVNNNASAERFFSMFEDDVLNFPIVIIADSKTEVKTPPIDDIPPINQRFGMGDISIAKDIKVNIDPSVLKLKKDVKLPADKPKKVKPTIQKAEHIKTKLPMLDYTGLAKVLVGFAVVVFVDEKYFKQIGNKVQTSVNYGDIIIVNRKSVAERFEYSKYSKNMKEFFKTLRYDVIAMQKRKQYVFGQVLFHSDAKLDDYNTKRNETTSLEGQCKLYRLENTELKEQIKELSQHQTDMQQTAEKLRLAQKKAVSLQQEIESKDFAYNELLEISKQKESSYRKNAELIAFYKQQIEIAEAFPTYKDDVCEWIEENFSKQLALTTRAKSEMKKYNGALNVAKLCDGIVFLNEYAKFRRQETPEEVLHMYAERNKWEVQNCGKEALKMQKADYTTTYNEKQYVLDLHIKLGIKSEDLIRIYFCWDDNMKKIIIGSMPKHLATVKQST